ncbi:MAG: enoyl-CoA hydratase/isomerase family protein [Saprospiraceae bacterium]|nr:enoyl-CoA hydratase/isomerase family protein [Saprospiraceae bacterium]MCF8250892.1 enoyl-CoA hydratase/isomerase family protein [Saprospiraceae bacterium]MCF8281148.1 enoyl-CoA hydratase/isomerase family protein [Bacteroidales bacterium]MCF8312707.1 enoyl-CoA hydratase/isomerase family protein [Saprospiraceae bacterium]MCF8441154.1 enoyl-CoA hydratase/isomerase family protein [Saprospiraceae bacterium]
MDKTQQGSVSLSVDNSIATIEFFHPAQNSLPGRLLAELVQAIEHAGEDKNSQIIVLRSTGDRTFCAGASFDELSSILDFETGKRFFLGFANVINAMRRCPKLIIGRVQGKAVGGGVGLAAATDYCMATQWATIKLSELAVGIGPFVVGPACERKLGLSAFSQMAINATEWQTAYWAKEKGLFNEVFEKPEQMDDYLGRFTKILVNSNPEALHHLKQVFWQGTEHWDHLLDERAAISGRLVLSEFTKNAIEAFKQK